MSGGYSTAPSPPSYQTGPGTPNPDKMEPDTYPQAQLASAAQTGEQYRAALFARCASGVHEPQRKYGVCGIITAIACFPCGLICLFTDSNMVCSRCGERIETPPKR